MLTGLRRDIKNRGEAPIKTDNLSWEMKVFYREYWKMTDEMSEIKATQRLIERLKRGDIPQIHLKFTFDDGSTYLMPIITIPENVKLIGFNHVPTFDTVDGDTKLMSEIWCVDVDYGEGVKL